MKARGGALIIKEKESVMATYAVICCVLLVLFYALLIYSERRGRVGQRYVFKTLASVMFIALGSAVFARGDVSAAERLPVWLGLCFSLVGDVFLAVYDHRRRDRFFALGVTGFGAAQISYSVYFIRAGVWSGWAVLAALAIASVPQIFIKVFQMKMDRPTRVLVTVYSILLSFAASCAFAWLLARGGTRALVMASGMALFLLSDIILLFKYFYDRPHPSLTALNLATYYGAQVLLALGIGVL